MVTPASPDPMGPARSLAEDLRARTDADLALLLDSRPDLTRPLPADVTALAARAATRPSIQRALDALNDGALHVLEALAVAGDPVDEAWAAELLGIGPATLTERVHELWRSALVWRGQDGLHVPHPVLDGLGPHVAGLAPGRADRATVREARARLDGLPVAERAILERLTWGPPTGTLGDAGPVADRVRTLVGQGLLESVAPGTVVLPRHVALALREGRLHREVRLTPPPVPLAPVSQERVDAVGGAAGGELLGHLDELAGLWGPAPPRVLRAGGLAVADLKRVADALDVSVEHAAFVVELAYAAGLVDDDGALEPVWAPTAAYDEWQQAPAARRWLILARAWLATTRAPHLVGSRAAPAPARGRPTDGRINALTEAASSALSRAVRHDLLALLAAETPGSAPDSDALVRRLSWLRPRRTPETLEPPARAALTEAALVGLVGYGALTSVGRRLLVEHAPGGHAGADAHASVGFGVAGLSGEAGAELGLESQLAEVLPAPVSHVLLQADLTAVAPGRIEGELARFLRLAADIESRGGASVYRFSADSLRRCLDAGWDQQRILAALESASTTGVPQPLAYLVGDVARRHGGLRVGAVASYVRSDDPLAIETMVDRRELAAYRLRRIAPTVAVSAVGVGSLIEGLRAAGLFPVAEAPDGGVVLPPVTHHRSASRRGPHRVPPTPVRTSRDAGAPASPGTSALVLSLRAGEADRDRAALHRDELAKAPLLIGKPEEIVGYLRDAAAAERAVWLSVADAQGSPRRLRLRPTRVEAGRAHGFIDEGPEHSYSLHRIMAVGPAG